MNNAKRKNWIDGWKKPAEEGYYVVLRDEDGFLVVGMAQYSVLDDAWYHFISRLRVKLENGVTAYQPQNYDVKTLVGIRSFYSGD